MIVAVRYRPDEVVGGREIKMKGGLASRLCRWLADANSVFRPFFAGAKREPKKDPGIDIYILHITFLCRLC